MRDQLSIMQEAGFADVEFVERTDMSTSKFTEGATFRAAKKKA